MIRIDLNSDGVLVGGQQLTSPSVYLDHWAIRLFSEDRDLGDRFATCLKGKRGTLVISWIGIMEFARVSSELERKLAEAFVRQTSPNIFFIESNPFKVDKREAEFVYSDTATAPEADQEMLKVILQQPTSGLEPFTLSDLFSILYEANENYHLSTIAQAIIERVAALRKEAEQAEGFRKDLHAPPNKRTIRRHTIDVFRELSRQLLIDPNIKMDENHAIDLLHATVPVAYCDSVLLDKHWTDTVRRARKRFESAGMSVAVAQTFSRRDDGIERFLEALENWTGI